MKINDIYGLDDNIEHFVIHSAEEELASVKIERVEIKKEDNGITFNFYCQGYDKDREKGRQKDLSDKLQNRVNKFHRNFIKNVEINVFEI